jgi:ferric-dicitrate binding protein FerR (iron transport regulator)
MKTNWKLIAKVLAGEANDREVREFESWSQMSEENKHVCDMLRKNWDSAKSEKESISIDVDRAWSGLYSRLEKEQLLPDNPYLETGRRSIAFKSLVRIAAIVTLLLALGITSYLAFRPVAPGSRLTARATDDQVFGLILPDGSTVDLNAATKISYRLDETGARRVRLKGEAWFDIHPDKEHPFLINAGPATIHVTGTSFSVRTVPGSRRIEVFVESGNVQFYRTRKQERKLSLKAGQMGVLEQDRLSEESRIRPNHTSWKTRKLTFRETRLGDVAGVLNRTYSQNIRFTNESLEDCLFTGTFDQQPIDSVVRVIQVAFDLEMDRDGKVYVLSGEGCN